MNALIVGGSGPTGHFIVNGLVRAGFRLTMLTRGLHDVPELPAGIQRWYADPYDPEQLARTLSGQRFDLCVATYGRLRAIAELTAGQVGHFVSVGGAPAYRGYMNPSLHVPAGLPAPTDERAETVRAESEDSKGWRVARTERAVFRHHPRATHFRYPFVYGPYQLAAREWCVVRRILDGRPHIVLPDGGLTLHSFGYAENVAGAVLLAAGRPDAAAGQIYNCADEEALTLRQVVEIIAAALGHRWEIVSMPWPLATPAKPLVGQPLTTHRLLSIAKLQRELGYRDLVAPREALARTARWLVAHPPAPGGVEETVLQDPFDYRGEDALIGAWKDALAGMPKLRWERPPGFGMAYSGPDGRARSRAKFVE